MSDNGAVRFLSLLADELETLGSDIGWSDDVAQLRDAALKRITRLQNRIAFQQETERLAQSTAKQAERAARLTLEEAGDLGEQVSSFIRLARALEWRVEQLEYKHGSSAE